MQPIAHIHTDFPTKFGVPRQSGLVDRLTSAIVFEPEFRNPDYLRGIEGWSHLWLIWQFHRVAPDDYSPTVLPPKLGGKTRVGVFATRSPVPAKPHGPERGAPCLRRLDGEGRPGALCDGCGHGRRNAHF